MSRQPLLFNGETFFITSTITSFIDVFTNPNCKHIMLDSIRHCQNEKGLLLYAWCLMSNHIHMIAGAEEGIAINNIMRDLKKFTSKRISDELNSNDSRKGCILNKFQYCGRVHPKEIKYKCWKDGYGCLELISAEVYDQKLDYIHNNPVKAEIVEEPHHYLYSSARNYAGLPGLLDVILQ